MKTTDVVIEKRQQCWSCEWHYTVTTAGQFTDVRTSARARSRWFVVVIFVGWLAARKKASVEAARPGERFRNGWSE